MTKFKIFYVCITHFLKQPGDINMRQETQLVINNSIHDYKAINQDRTSLGYKRCQLLRRIVNNNQNMNDANMIEIVTNFLLDGKILFQGNSLSFWNRHTVNMRPSLILRQLLAKRLAKLDPKIAITAEEKELIKNLIEAAKSILELDEKVHLQFIL